MNKDEREKIRLLVHHGINTNCFTCPFDVIHPCSNVCKPSKFSDVEFLDFLNQINDENFSLAKSLLIESGAAEKIKKELATILE